MDKRNKIVAPRLAAPQIEVLELIAERTGSTPTGVLNSLVPSRGVARILADEAVVQGSVRDAQDQLIAEAILGRLRARGVEIRAEDEAELLEHPRRVFRAWSEYVSGRIEEMVPDRVGLGDLLDSLEADDFGARLDAGRSLISAAARGLRAQGADRAEMDRIGRLVGRAIAGDRDALDELREALTDDRTSAGDAPPEPSSEARRLGLEHGPDSIIDMIESERSDERRHELVTALFTAIGARMPREARQHLGALVELGAGLARGDRDAIEAARRWTALNLTAPAREEVE